MTVPAITGLDHVIVLTDDLDAVSTLYERLGFLLTAPGQHRHGASRNRTAVFDDNYIELLHHAPEAGRADRFLGQPRGPVAIGLQTPDSQRVHDELVALGHAVPAAAEGGRPVELPGHGVFNARFVTQRFPDAFPNGAPGGQPVFPTLFSCQHLTRDLVFRPEWREHPNGAMAITALHLVHEKPLAVAAGYVELFGVSRFGDRPSGFDMRLGRVTITARTPAEFRRSFPGIEPAASESGWFAGMSLRVRSLRDTTAYLEAAKIPAIATAEGLAVSPARAGGAVLVFHES